MKPALALLDEELQFLAKLIPNKTDIYPTLRSKVEKLFSEPRGVEWLGHLEKLPEFNKEHSFLDAEELGATGHFSNEELALEALKGLRPWRKGPFVFGDLKIDTEWQSWQKWNRLKEAVSPLAGRKVLDIGCNSGYYLMRIAAQKPKIALGVDPFALYFAQYHAVKHVMQEDVNTCMLPVGVEAIYPLGRVFDTVFCMGILYHRKSPLEFLREVQGLLKPGGELVLETITIPGEGPICLSPPNNYQRMKNVYFLPTVDCLVSWLENYGFKNVRVISTELTTPEEQRPTKWSYGDSLPGALDPNDPSKTIEGHPAPMRTLVLADAK